MRILSKNPDSIPRNGPGKLFCCCTPPATCASLVDGFSGVSFVVSGFTGEECRSAPSGPGLVKSELSGVNGSFIGPLSILGDSWSAAAEIGIITVTQYDPYITGDCTSDPIFTNEYPVYIEARCEDLFISVSLGSFVTACSSGAISVFNPLIFTPFGCSGTSLLGLLIHGESATVSLEFAA